MPVFMMPMDLEGCQRQLPTTLVKKQPSGVRVSGPGVRRHGTDRKYWALGSKLTYRVWRRFRPVRALRAPFKHGEPTDLSSDVYLSINLPRYKRVYADMQIDRLSD